ncbi:copper homeostasis protein CutC [uncultured Anaerococcus sp.]|uniref:copper homeostasis protein CutC n=1 Tax=uncultured Anaerococcus sp. TaxID=293428 RepID=UPI002889313E|nr:copper homeostasis protein CutC [uncultured Anaerococcus sp.]
MKLEICIDSFDGMIGAYFGGADRVEICSALTLDGLTPSAGLVDICCNYDNIEKFVMVRPRPGHFTYDEFEIGEMKATIIAFKDKPIDGFVLGVLDSYGRLDIETMKELVYLAFPKKVVLHRAFDYSIDGEEKIEELIKMGVDRILTSGKKPKAVEGLDLIREIQEKYGDKIEIMAGSGVNYENIREIYEKTGIENFHLSASFTGQTEIDYDNFGEDFLDYRWTSSGLVEAARMAVDELKK